MAAVLKTVERKLRGFESYPLRHSLLLPNRIRSTLSDDSRCFFTCGLLKRHGDLGYPSVMSRSSGSTFPHSRDDRTSPFASRGTPSGHRTGEVAEWSKASAC